MHMITELRIGIAAAAIAALSIAPEAPAQHAQPALAGLDAVTYFDPALDAPRSGDESIAILRDGATYLFISDEHAHQFEASPSSYVPMFDGLDPVLLARGEHSEGDAHTFTIIDGLLYLFETDASRNDWLASYDALAPRALDNWTMGQSDERADLVRGTLARNASKHQLKGELGAAGYDVVAYFPEGGDRPAKGNKKITCEYRGVTYRFSSPEHRARFMQRPSRYEPAYGGWCAYAAAKQDYTKPNPKRYLVQNDRLMLFYDGFLGDTYKSWNKEGPAQLEAEADEWWLDETGERPPKRVDQ